MILYWGFVPALAILAVLHYLLAALALRAVAGIGLPLREATLIQFTAAAANRVTPGGIGASAVNIRYLTCRGMTGPHAVAAVGTLHTVDAFGSGGLCLIVLAAAPIPLPARTAGVSPWMLVAGVAVAAVVVLALAMWRRRAIVETLVAMRAMCRRPKDLVVTLLTCALTTLVLGIAFALSVLAVPGAAGPAALPTLLACYFVGSSAGSAIPIPAGIGTTEAALVTALAGAGVGAGDGLEAVILFRAITFWTPVPIGLFAARRLRRPSTGRTDLFARIPFFTAPARINPAREA